MSDLRRIRRGLLGSVIAVAAMAAPARGQVATQPAIEEATALVDSLLEAQGLPGVSVAVGVDGAIVWSRGFGAADRASDRPVTTTTMFRIGSVSKSVTAPVSFGWSSRGVSISMRRSSDMFRTFPRSGGRLPPGSSPGTWQGCDTTGTTNS